MTRKRDKTAEKRTMFLSSPGIPPGLFGNQGAAGLEGKDEARACLDTARPQGWNRD